MRTRGGVYRQSLRVGPRGRIRRFDRAPADRAVPNERNHDGSREIHIAFPTKTLNRGDLASTRISSRRFPLVRKSWGLLRLPSCERARIATHSPCCMIWTSRFRLAVRRRTAAHAGGGANRARSGSEFPEAVSEEFMRLLRGAGFSPAPPWGSVYMDRDKVMYGRTWVMLRDWMRAHGVDGRVCRKRPRRPIRAPAVACRAGGARPPRSSVRAFSAITFCAGPIVFSMHFSKPCLPIPIAALLLLCKATLYDVRGLLADRAGACAGCIAKVEAVHGGRIQRRVACGVHGARSCGRAWLSPSWPLSF